MQILGMKPDGLARAGMAEPHRRLLFDPQTSGGLLSAVSRDALDAILTAFRAEAEPVWTIGEAIAGPSGGIEIV